MRIRTTSGRTTLPTGAEDETLRIVTFGEMLLRLQAPGHERLLRGSSLETHFGGSEVNVAVALAHLSASAEVVTVLPENAIGDRAVEVLLAHGVEAHATRDAGRFGLYFAERGRPPRPAQVLYDRSGSSFAAHTSWTRTVRWFDLLRGCARFHTSGITPALSPAAHRATADALEAARSVGTPTSFDLNYRGALWPDEASAGDRLRPILHGVDLLIANAFHLERCFGLRASASDDAALSEQLAAACSDLGVQSLALTDRREHEDGTQTFEALLWRGRLERSRPWKLRETERIGSGDAFTAGLIYALAAEHEDPIGLATAAGAFKLSEPGDWSTASLEEVETARAGRTTGIAR
ncbi:MAG: sugar kinase [Acidobacteriota bacterium]